MTDSDVLDGPWRLPSDVTNHNAGDRLGFIPAECLYVDGEPSLVAAAIELEYRDWYVPRSCHHGVRSIKTLTETRTA